MSAIYRTSTQWHTPCIEYTDYIIKRPSKVCVRCIPTLHLPLLALKTSSMYQLQHCATAQPSFSMRYGNISISITNYPAWAVIIIIVLLAIIILIILAFQKSYLFPLNW